MFDISFLMQNNLKIIIKTFSTIYLSLAEIFPSVPSYWHYDSMVHKPQNIVYDTSKKVSTSNCLLLKIIIPLRTIFNLIKFYPSVLNVNLIHVDIIYAAPKFGFSERGISPNYLSLAAIFPSVPSYWHYDSMVQKPQYELQTRWDRVWSSYW